MGWQVVAIDIYLVGKIQPRAFGGKSQIVFEQADRKLDFKREGIEQ